MTTINLDSEWQVVMPSQKHSVVSVVKSFHCSIFYFFPFPFLVMLKFVFVIFDEGGPRKCSDYQKWALPCKIHRRTSF